MQKNLFFLILLFCSTSYAQRPFSDASPQADHNAENSRILKLGYKTAGEYKVADPKIDAKEGSLTKSYEYGSGGFLSVLVDYAYDDSTKSYYRYEFQGVLQVVNMVTSSEEISIGYSYNKKGLLDEIIIAAAEARDEFVKHNKDGTIKEIDVRMPRLDMDENGEIIEPHKIINFPYQKVAYTYDKNKRPIIENTSKISSDEKSQIKYSYDASGRVTNIIQINSSNYQTSEDFTYGTSGDLVMRVFTDGKDKSYFKFVYEK